MLVPVLLNGIMMLLAVKPPLLAEPGNTKIAILCLMMWLKHLRYHCRMISTLVSSALNDVTVKLPTTSRLVVLIPLVIPTYRNVKSPMPMLDSVALILPRETVGIFLTLLRRT